MGLPELAALMAANNTILALQQYKADVKIKIDPDEAYVYIEVPIDGYWRSFEATADTWTAALAKAGLEALKGAQDG